MKPFILLLVMLSPIFHLNLYSQSKTQKRTRSYSVKLKLLDKEKVKGKLIGISDTEISILIDKTEQSQDFSFSEIKGINIKRKGAAFGGALIGGGSMGLISIATRPGNGDPVESGIHAAKGFGLVLLGILGGAIIGGATSRYYKINGELEPFTKFKTKYQKKMNSALY